MERTHFRKSEIIHAFWVALLAISTTCYGENVTITEITDFMIEMTKEIINLNDTLSTLQQRLNTTASLLQQQIRTTLELQTTINTLSRLQLQSSAELSARIDECWQNTSVAHAFLTDRANVIQRNFNIHTMELSEEIKRSQTSLNATLSARVASLCEASQSPLRADILQLRTRVEQNHVEFRNFAARRDAFAHQPDRPPATFEQQRTVPVRVVFPGCGASLVGSGVIRSPGYPQHYENSLRCTWNVQAATGHSALSVVLRVFSTEQCCDFLIISDGSGNQSRISGVHLLTSYVIRSPATLSFETDGSVTAPGFEIGFNSIQDLKTTSDHGCSGSLVGSGVIVSPGYPQPYSNYLNCTWTLQAGRDSRGMTVHVRQFITEPCCDHLRISDVFGLQRALSGVQPPTTFNVTSPAVISFTTDGSVTNTGFHLEITSV